MSNLSADRPKNAPEEDRFNHDPFAKTLAKGIGGIDDTTAKDGLVLALYGPWGSGKSTVLNFVCHYLEKEPEKLLIKSPPIVVRFNPWWFSGHENLARAFFDQLQTVLFKDKDLKKETKENLTKKIGEWSKAIGVVSGTALGAILGGAVGAGIVAKVGEALGEAIGSQQKRYKENLVQLPKDVQTLKNEISQILEEAQKRILVVIDDIDRLMPDEIRQLFTVIKALADFPYIVYLLAFDREVVAQAIKKQTGLPGKKYLEKIIQVPLEMPPTEDIALHSALFERLNEIFDGTPEELFDVSYWGNVYWGDVYNEPTAHGEGINALIQVPRDVVRFTNTLAVTYPDVRSEVNAVDFIALEAFRVFQPKVYDVIRNNLDKFTGSPTTETEIHNFHSTWLQDMPEKFRENIQCLVNNVFPKTINSNKPPVRCLSQDECLRQLRACHPKIFPVYFRLSVSPNAISRNDMIEMLKSSDSPTEFGEILVQAKSEYNATGMSKSFALLKRLLGYINDIKEENIPNVIQALFNVGDSLKNSGDKLQLVNIDDYYIIYKIIISLLKRISSDRHTEILELAIKNNNAVTVQLYFLRQLEKESFPFLPESGTKQLKVAWLERIRILSDEPNFIEAHPDLPILLNFWKEFGNETEVRKWTDKIITHNCGILVLLPKLIRYTRVYNTHDLIPHTYPHLYLKNLKSFLDLDLCEKLLNQLEREEKIPDEAKESVSTFHKEFNMLKTGKNLDDFDVSDE
jgi:predicted KAP-like P-loop ATPase